VQFVLFVVSFSYRTIRSYSRFGCCPKVVGYRSSAPFILKHRDLGCPPVHGHSLHIDCLDASPKHVFFDIPNDPVCKLLFNLHVNSLASFFEVNVSIAIPSSYLHYRQDLILARRQVHDY